MSIDWRELRKFRHEYDGLKSDMVFECDKIIAAAKNLGLVQKSGHEDVRVCLAFIDGFIAGAEYIGTKKKTYGE